MLCSDEQQICLNDEYVIVEDAEVKSLEGRILKSESYVVINCSEGVLNFAVDMREMSIMAGSVVYLMPRQLYEIIHVSEDFRATLLCMSESFLQWLDLKQTMFYRDLSGLPIRATSYGSFEKYIDICKDIIRIDQNPEKKEVIYYLTKAYLLAMSHFRILEPGNARERNASSEIMERFMNMLHPDDIFHRSVGYYACALCISPKHLSSVSRKITGFGATYWIDRTAILNAKRLLTSTCLPISEISSQLEFSNQSSFGSFFKQHTGMTPSEYRKTASI